MDVETQAEDTGSLADHEASYGRSGRDRSLGTEVVSERSSDSGTDGSGEGQVDAAAEEPEVSGAEESKPARERDESGKFVKSHRAESHKASPEDVPRIKELTRRLRETEESFQRYRAEYEARANQPEPIRTTEPQKTTQSASFSEAEPTIEQFSGQEDPYLAWVRAYARWEARKENFEQRQAQEQQRSEWHAEQEKRAAQDEYVRTQQEYRGRLETFIKDHPDFTELMESQKSMPLTPLAETMLLLHTEGPKLVYYLMQHPDELAGLHLLTDGKPVTDQTVALAARWLEARAQAGTTGSAVPSQQKRTLPPPPNPVRTVPSKTVSPLDDETSSLSDHERAYGRKRR